MQNRFRCHDGWIAESSPAVANPCTCFYSDRSSPCLPTTTAITNTYASNGMTLSRVVSLSCLSNGQSRGANFFCVNIGEREELSCRYTFRFISSRRTLCTTDSGGYPVACSYCIYGLRKTTAQTTILHSRYPTVLVHSTLLNGAIPYYTVGYRQYKIAHLTGSQWENTTTVA